jgi:mannan polymerase II complex MNN10 subunit
MLRIDRARSTVLAAFAFICFIIYLRSGPPEPEATGNSRIAVASMTTGESSYDYASLSNKFGYAQKHGYHIEFDWHGDGFWHKLNILERLIKRKKYDWILMIDFDTLITNMTVKVEDLVEESIAQAPDPKKIDIIFTPDW